MVFSSVPESSSGPQGILFSTRVFLVTKCYWDIFTWRLSLPTWGLAWTGWLTPSTGLWLVAISRGAGPTCQVPSYLVVVIGGDAGRLRGRFLGVDI
jgi:hypothetical protein